MSDTVDSLHVSSATRSSFVSAGVRQILHATVQVGRMRSYAARINWEHKHLAGTNCYLTVNKEHNGACRGEPNYMTNKAQPLCIHD